MESFSFSGLWGDARTLLISAGILAGSALAGIVTYLALFSVAARVSPRSKSTLQGLLVKQTRPPARYIFPFLALTFAVQATPLPEHLRAQLEHFFTLCLIGALGWLLITVVRVTSTLIRMRYSIAAADNLHARRIHTQTEASSASSSAAWWSSPWPPCS
jgi:hypothetical protein